MNLENYFICDPEMGLTADKLIQMATQRAEAKRFYKSRLILYRLRHGLVLFSIQNLLTRIGIDIGPFWIEREGLDLCEEPKLRDDASLYQLKYLDIESVFELFELLHWRTDTLRKELPEEYKVVGLYRGNDLAAMMMIRFKEFKCKSKVFPLEENEAYLENMYTYENFRGKNLAPYLRYQCYKILAEEGKTVCYSMTQCFNTSSRKFKAKLGARHQELYLHIGLFKRFGRTFLLRRYPVTGN